MKTKPDCDDDDDDDVLEASHHARNRIDKTHY